MSKKVNSLAFFATIIIFLSCFKNSLLASAVDSNIISLSTHKSNKWGALKSAFLENIFKEFSAKIFVETGTADGETAELAAAFALEVHTVELDENLYNQALIKLKNKPNVIVYFGHSPQIIATIGSQLKETIAFWLDAHAQYPFFIQGPETSQADRATPIIKEIQAIGKAVKESYTILIDDIRYFGSQIGSKRFNGYWGYTINEVCATILSVNPHMSFAVLGDILLAYDKTKYNPSLSPAVKALTISRLFDGKNVAEQELLTAEEVVMRASGSEKEFLCDLYSKMRGEGGVPEFYSMLWYGLIALGENNNEEAYTAFNKVINEQGYNHWRVFWYLALAAARTHRMPETLQALEKVRELAPQFEPGSNLLLQLTQK